ncbi:Sec-independent protein translocase subunit TatA [Gordonia sp. (in: high G+C Gram-positive bacteria)]|uniref:Sec-independent protein translocase subunit TatA n=1 Tax=Gordonia sp. (in: high G+C Gram-positive bacteria) TaxID=84139 RepID=UPI003C755532
MGAMSAWHWAIVLIVLVLLFGSAKLPGAARGLGRSLRIFKSEMQEMASDGKNDAASDATDTTAPRELPAAEKPAVADQTQPTDKKTA